MLGDIHLFLGDFKGAIGGYQKILVIDPHNVVAMNNLAWLLSNKLKQHQEALILADRGLEVHPNYMDLLDTRGGIHLALEQYQLAIDDLKKCIELYPVDAPQVVTSSFYLGKAYAGAGHPQEAIQALDQAMELSKRVVYGLTPEQQAEAQALKNRLLTES